MRALRVREAEKKKHRGVRCLFGMGTKGCGIRPCIQLFQGSFLKTHNFFKGLLVRVSLISVIQMDG